MTGKKKVFILQKINIYQHLYRCFKFETAEEIMDALQKDGTDFASNAAKAILDRSPTCTKVNVENFNRISEMSFVDTIKSEFKLWDATTVSL